MASDPSLRTVFEALDEDNLGYITDERFSDLAKEFGVYNPDERHRLVTLLDPHNTGKISFASFCQGIEAVVSNSSEKALPREPPLILPDHWIGSKTIIDDDDTHSIGTSESTYNEYDDSALTDMSEDNTSPLLYDGFNPSLDGDDTDSAIAGPTLNMNGFLSSSDSLRVPQIVEDSSHASSLPSDDEQRFEDFGQNADGIEIEIQDASSLSDSVDTIEREAPASILNGSLLPYDSRSRPIMMKRDVWSHVRRMKCSLCNNRMYLSPVRRISSKEFANHLYRSSSSSNLPHKGAIDELYGEYAASDTDVMELNDKVLELETQVTVLEQDKATRVGHQGKLQSEKLKLMHQVQSLEEQIREVEMKHQEREDEHIKRHKDLMAKKEKEMEEQIELLTNRIASLEEEKTQHVTETSRLKTQMDHLKQENSRLEAQVLDLDNRWLALSMDYQQKQDNHHRERTEMKETLKANNVLVEDLSREIEELRRENLEQREYGARLMRSPSISDLPSRFSEIKDELQRLKKENANLRDSNDEMSAQMLNDGFQIGRSLLHRGTSRSESFASELEKSSKDDIMQALREEEQLNRDLREYIGRILARILDRNPELLEIRPKRHGSVASLMSLDPNT
ncbi:rab11 family-interacting protein 4B-like isoform X2 [Acanthaster planci]|uniref:Rab11 family-interacting protein 4B-like isoform X2 n=1 Tax=Acanthaster planci TaxID=133434 RepID=A0A8B7XWZ6_ACAPL|nr:rab11 family-interacting protein 4B-like isoform X2 [Acanthaster planci]